MVLLRFTGDTSVLASVFTTTGVVSFRTAGLGVVSFLGLGVIGSFFVVDTFGESFFGVISTLGSVLMPSGVVGVVPLTEVVAFFA